jgi:hypothetical protein
MQKITCLVKSFSDAKAFMIFNLIIKSDGQKESG